MEFLSYVSWCYVCGLCHAQGTNNSFGRGFAMMNVW